MQSTQFHLDRGAHERTQVYRWMPDQAPRASLQIIHGMAEHGGRYARLAEVLTGAGIAVYAQDLPGHGRSVRVPQDLGHFADDEGWRHALDAIDAVRRQIVGEQRGLPLFLLGHSMGSFLLQAYVRAHGAQLAGAIFSAASGDVGAMRAVGLALLRLEALWYGRRHRSAVAERLSFADFNRRFQPNRTAFDWLSRDPAEVDRYIKDPRCGFRCSCALWIELLQFCGRLDEPAALARLPRQLPLLIVGGSADPATDGERGPRALEQLLRKAALEDVSLRLYAGARHELFNETCRDEVMNDVRTWLLQHLAQS